MTLKKSLLQFSIFIIALSFKGFAQAPVANFSVSSTTVCAGAVVQITDLSTNGPTAWSYTLNVGQGPMGTTTASVQNPTITYNNAGTKTITLIATNGSGVSTAVTHTLVVIASPNAAINPNSVTICPGSTVSLAVTTGSANTVQWNTGATTTAIVVSPTTTTTYTCIITNAGGCPVTRTATVATGQPTVTISGSPATICGGSTATLTASSTGQAPYTYSWSTSATTRTITTNAAGVYSVTVSSGTCSSVRSFTLGTSTSISVSATASPTTVCAGSTASISATGATTYSWSTGSANQTTTVSPTANTTYTVVGTSGTCTGVATVSISVHASPTLVVSSSPATVCAGGSATLTATGATNYFWAGQGTGSMVVVTPTANTTYTAIGLNQGCPPKTASLSVGYSEAPTVVAQSTATFICVGSTATLTASGADTYAWSTGDNTATVSVTPIASNSYTVLGTNAAGCTNSATITEDVTLCTGLKNLSQTATVLTIYPNPNNGNFTLAAQENLSITLINETGQLVKTVLLNEANHYQAALTGLATGIYFITGSTANGVVKQKIIVTR